MVTAVKGFWSVDAAYAGPLSGWVTPDGKFYPCEDFQHARLAYDLGKDCDRLLDAGWLHVGEDLGLMLADGRYPTNSQHDLLDQIIRHPHCPYLIKAAHEKMLADPFKDNSWWRY